MLVSQSFSILWYPMEPARFLSVHGILQALVLERVATLFSRASF